jgi:hypothetical protein
LRRIGEHSHAHLLVGDLGDFVRLAAGDEPKTFYSGSEIGNGNPYV